MAVPLIIIGTHNGANIYRSANTHPRAKTRSLTTLITSPKVPRFRYNVGSSESYMDAYKKCAEYIDKHKTAPATDMNKK